MIFRVTQWQSWPHVTPSLGGPDLTGLTVRTCDANELVSFHIKSQTMTGKYRNKGLWLRLPCLWACRPPDPVRSPWCVLWCRLPLLAGTEGSQPGRTLTQKWWEPPLSRVSDVAVESKWEMQDRGGKHFMNYLKSLITYAWGFPPRHKWLHFITFSEFKENEDGEGWKGSVPHV